MGDNEVCQKLGSKFGYSRETQEALWHMVAHT